MDNKAIDKERNNLENRLDAIAGIKRHCEYDLLNSDCGYLGLGCKGCITEHAMESFTGGFGKLISNRKEVIIDKN